MSLKRKPSASYTCMAITNQAHRHGGLTFLGMVKLSPHHKHSKRIQSANLTPPAPIHNIICMKHVIVNTIGPFT